MRTIRLYGSLADEYGDSFELAVRSAPEAVRALECNFPGFMDRIKTGDWFIAYGDDDKDKSTCLTEDSLPMELGEGPIHIVPQAIGAGGDGKGIFATIVGIAIVSAAIVASGGAAAAPAAGAAGAAGTAGAAGGTAFLGISYTSIGLFGAALAVSGVASLISPIPEAIGSEDNREDPENRASFLFNGAINTSEQGGPVPVVFGRYIVGSKVISGGISIEDIS